MNRLVIALLLVTACGGAQPEDAQTANDAEGSSEPAAQASRPDGAEHGPAESPDEVAALEGEDLSGYGGERSDGEGTTGGVARGHSGGSLQDRRSSMPGEQRRSRRAPAPETLDMDTIEATIDEHIREVHFCYEREFRHRPDVSGRVVVAATIAPDGHVSEAHIVSSTIRSARVDQCVIQTFSRWEFPRAQAPTTVEHPFTLTHH